MLRKTLLPLGQVFYLREIPRKRSSFFELLREAFDQKLDRRNPLIRKVISDLLLSP